MTIREDVSNFKFFDIVPHDEVVGVHDIMLTGSMTTPTIDTQGYDTLTFGWMHGSMMSVGSAGDVVHVRMQHASNSTTGRDTLGSWSDCTATDVYGQDMYRLISTLTMDSWLALDALTREPYLYSMAPDVASTVKAVSGCFTFIGISITSQASCKTTSFVPTVAYVGKQRWVRLVFSLSIAATTGVGSMELHGYAMLGRSGQWPVCMAEVV